MLVFEWDARKAAVNRLKHGISLEEASTVFDDPLAIIFPDDEHSFEELRAFVIGHSILQRLLIVSFTERPGGRLRIISARKLTPNEQRDYEEHDEG